MEGRSIPTIFENLHQNKAWFSVLKRKNYELKSLHFLYSAHLKEEDIFHSINRKRRHLRPGAKPSKFSYSKEANPRKTFDSMKSHDQLLLSSKKALVSIYNLSQVEKLKILHLKMTENRTRYTPSTLLCQYNRANRERWFKRRTKELVTFIYVFINKKYPTKYSTNAYFTYTSSL
nr:uncharacterized protein LOC121118470 [Lepeophtheirus salmonis]